MRRIRRALLGVALGLVISLLTPRADASASIVYHVLTAALQGNHDDCQAFIADVERVSYHLVHIKLSGPLTEERKAWLEKKLAGLEDYYEIDPFTQWNSRAQVRGWYLAARERLLGSSLPQTAWTVSSWGVVYFALGIQRDYVEQARAILYDPHNFLPVAFTITEGYAGIVVEWG